MSCRDVFNSIDARNTYSSKAKPRDMGRGSLGSHSRQSHHRHFVQDSSNEDADLYATTRSRSPNPSVTSYGRGDSDDDRSDPASASKATIEAKPDTLREVSSSRVRSSRRSPLIEELPSDPAPIHTHFSPPSFQQGIASSVSSPNIDSRLFKQGLRRSYPPSAHSAYRLGDNNGYRSTTPDTAAPESVQEDDPQARIVASLEHHIKTLQEELQVATEKNKQLSAMMTHESSHSTWPTLHRVKCDRTDGQMTYADAPTRADDKASSHLEGLWSVNEEAWERRNAHRPFVVYETHQCPACERPRHTAKDEPEPEADEVILILSERLIELIHLQGKRIPGLQAYLDYGLLHDATITPPYIFFFHFGVNIQKTAADENLEAYDDLQLLWQLLEQRTQDARSKISTQLDDGYVQDKYIPWLFKPGELLIHRSNLVTVVEQTEVIIETYKTEEETSFRICSRFIHFDGQFRRKEATLILRFKSQAKHKITDLEVYPYRHASKELKDEQLRLGQEFFACRKWRYVTLNDSVGSGNDMHDVRFMVDVDAYKMMHKDKKVDDLENGSPSIAEIDIGGNETLLLQLPRRVQGFHMHEKRWMNLPIDSIKDVKWNAGAFDHLVIADETKELIRALVQNKIDSKESIDFVPGKGTGLIVLLHGGPGTGKTLTAESVAEIAKRPLYRVTCGDVGTDPIEVEEYLESVFQLGRRWKCVVLLDEADVFLEQRELNNLKRNALVSVFLRVLEYYDGILILTSNRVGTLDEAFRSRIQLALYYPNLDTSQREKIWADFIERLHSLQEQMDYKKVRNAIGDLAAYNTNGRQIRNIINTARQLARHRGENLSVDHFKHVIKVSRGFEDHLRMLYEDNDSDEIAHQMKWRPNMSASGS